MNAAMAFMSPQTLHASPVADQGPTTLPTRLRARAMVVLDAFATALSAFGTMEFGVARGAAGLGGFREDAGNPFTPPHR